MGQAAALLFVILATFIQDSYGYDAVVKDLDCAEAKDGTYADPVYCHRFYQCRQGVAHQFTCPRTMVYNPAMQICDKPENYICEFKCPLEDGTFSDPSYCDAFYHCRNHVAIHMTCPPDYPVFNPIVRTCDLKENYECTENIAYTTMKPSEDKSNGSSALSEDDDEEIISGVTGNSSSEEDYEDSGLVPVAPPVSGMGLVPPNYAKCVNISNTSPDSLMVTVTYKDEQGEVKRSTTIHGGDSFQFKEEMREQGGGTYTTVIPVYKLEVVGEDGEKLEQMVEVEGVQGCVNGTMERDGTGYRIIPGTNFLASAYYGLPCSDKCSYKDSSYSLTSSNYMWCDTEKGWDYCSQYTGEDYMGRTCISTCSASEEAYTWCYVTGETWGYCSSLNPDIKNSSMTGPKHNSTSIEPTYVIPSTNQTTTIPPTPTTTTTETLIANDSDIFETVPPTKSVDTVEITTDSAIPPPPENKDDSIPTRTDSPIPPPIGTDSPTPPENNADSIDEDTDSPIQPPISTDSPTPPENSVDNIDIATTENNVDSVVAATDSPTAPEKAIALTLPDSVMVGTDSPTEPENNAEPEAITTDSPSPPPDNVDPRVINTDSSVTTGDNAEVLAVTNNEVNDVDLANLESTTLIAATERPTTTTTTTTTTTAPETTEIPTTTAVICEGGCANGVCVSPGVCECDAGWESSDCSQAVCAGGCVNGSCISPNVCSCDEGWEGLDCSQAVCEGGCVNGACSSPQVCTCEPGWEGGNCSQAVCSPECVNGACSSPDICTCEDGWDDVDCTQATCPSGCEHGACNSPGVCTCEAGWEGEDCNQAVCSGGCKHGSCKKPDTCKCHKGWKSDDCSKAICKPSCDNGYCKSPGVCKCKGGWGGDDCSKVKCSGDSVAIGDACYYVSKEKTTQSKAKSFCKAKGLKLVSMKHSKENEAIKSYLKKNKGSYAYWVSLKKSGKYYKWGNGLKSKFFDWAPKNPRGKRKNWKCVAMYKSEGYEWKDLKKCETLYRFICK